MKKLNIKKMAESMGFSREKRGFCVECDNKVNEPKDRRPHNVYNLLTLSIKDVQNFDNDLLVPEGRKIITQTLTDKGIGEPKGFQGILLKEDTTLRYRDGRIINMSYCCQECGMTIYNDFMGKERNNKFVSVKLIGVRGSGKTCFCVSAFKAYGKKK